MLTRMGDIPTHHLEQRFVAMRKSECCDLVAFNGSRDSLLGAVTGSIGFAERPQRQCENNQRRNAGILSKAECKVVVALTVIDGERFFQVCASRREVARSQDVEPSSRWATPASADFGRFVVPLTKASALSRAWASSP